MSSSPSGHGRERHPGPGPDEAPGRGFQGGSCGQDVIHQKDLEAPDRSAAAEATPEIPKSVASTQPGLRRSCASPEEATNGKVQSFAQGLGQDGGLVESPPEETEPGERDRDDQIRLVHGFVRELPRQERPQIPGQEIQATELQGVDHERQGRFVTVERHESAPGRRITQALTADTGTSLREGAPATPTAASRLTEELSPAGDAEAQELIVPWQGLVAPETGEGKQGFQGRSQPDGETMAVPHTYTSRRKVDGAEGDSPSRRELLVRESNEIGGAILLAPPTARIETTEKETRCEGRIL